MSEKITEFKIGCDAEFVCLDKYKKIIRATDYVETHGDLGADGNEMIFEVRPEPSNDPIDIVKNIHDIFSCEISRKNILHFEWCSGSYYDHYPLGGHIHFGIKNIDYQKIVYVLDNYLGSLSLLIENRDEGINRRREGYGFMGDWREKEHGFEYRVVSSWLVSPYMAYAILCLSKTIVYEFLNNKEYKWNNYFTYLNKSVFSQMRLYPIKQKFLSIWRDITKMILYQKYKLHIDLIYFLVKNELTWFPKTTMKEAWGIMDLSRIDRINKIDLDIIWLKYNSLKKQNIL